MKKITPHRRPADKLPKSRGGTALSLAVTVVLLLTVFAAGLQAATEDIKSRMRERLPAIVELKEVGAVGENSQGYLEYRGEARPRQELIQAENHDRQQVYAAIGLQQGVSADFVGKRRAQQIAANAPPGVWLQDENGDWYQKK